MAQHRPSVDSVHSENHDVQRTWSASVLGLRGSTHGSNRATHGSASSQPDGVVPGYTRKAIQGTNAHRYSTTGAILDDDDPDVFSLTDFLQHCKVFLKRLHSVNVHGLDLLRWEHDLLCLKSGIGFCSAKILCWRRAVLSVAMAMFLLHLGFAFSSDVGRLIELWQDTDGGKLLGMQLGAYVVHFRGYVILDTIFIVALGLAKLVSATGVVMARWHWTHWRKSMRYVVIAWAFGYGTPYLLYILIPFRLGFDTRGLTQHACEDFLFGGGGTWTSDSDAIERMFGYVSASNIGGTKLSSLLEQPLSATLSTHGLTLDISLCEERPEKWVPTIEQQLQKFGLVSEHAIVCPAAEVILQQLKQLDAQGVQLDPLESSFKQLHEQIDPTDQLGANLEQLAALQQLAPGEINMTFVTQMSCASPQTLRQLQWLDRFAAVSEGTMSLMFSMRLSARTLVFLTPSTFAMILGAFKGCAVAKITIPYSRVPGLLLACAVIFTLPFFVLLVVLMNCVLGAPIFQLACAFVISRMCVFLPWGHLFGMTDSRTNILEPQDHADATRSIMCRFRCAMVFNVLCLASVLTWLLTLPEMQYFIESGLLNFEDLGIDLIQTKSAEVVRGVLGFIGTYYSITKVTVLFFVDMMVYTVVVIDEADVASRDSGNRQQFADKEQELMREINAAMFLLSDDDDGVVQQLPSQADEDGVVQQLPGQATQDDMQVASDIPQIP